MLEFVLLHSYSYLIKYGDILKWHRDNYLLYFVPGAYSFGFPMTTMSFSGVALSLFLTVLGLPCCTSFSLVARIPGSLIGRVWPFHSGGFSCGTQDLEALASVTVAWWPSCSTACGIVPHQGLNPPLLYWQVDSLPLSHKGSPDFEFKVQLTSAFFFFKPDIFAIKRRKNIS